MAPKILLCGDVFGRFNHLFKRVHSVNKSAGPFDALLCVGQFFPESPDQFEEFMDYIDGRSEVPIPTYFTGDYGIGAPKVLSAALSNSANLGFKMDGIKVCEKLYWLRGSGKFTLHGLSVAYLSGRKSSGGQLIGTYSQDDVDALRAMAEEPGIVDLFLTNEWPVGVTNRASTSDLPSAVSDSLGSDSIVSELVAEIKPRYHVAGTKGVFYSREPYSNIDAVHVTRFIGLASVGNKEKQKFMHAISPTPAFSMSAAEISMKPPNTTLSPYTSVEPADQPEKDTKRSSDAMSDSQYWRYDVSQKRHKSGFGGREKQCFKFIYSGSCPRGEKCNFQHAMDSREQYLRGACIDFIIKGKCERGPDCNFKHDLVSDTESYSQRKTGSKNFTGNRSKECWFCLSSPTIESHLIASIGESYYCALPKGALVQDHVLLIPIEHSPSTLSLSEECESELDKLLSSLKLYHQNRGKDTVAFEWISKRSTHANLQAVPVPSSRVGALPKIFNMAAEKLGFEFVTKKFNSSSMGRKWLRTQFDRNYSFFYVQLPDGTILSHTVEENETFPAQFGREVLAGLLNIADKADWRNCSTSKEEETKMAEDFKKGFDGVNQAR